MTPDYQSGFHISGRAYNLTPWALVSVYNQNGGSMGSGIFTAENFALNMETCAVVRIAHAQSYWSASNYYSEPHSSPNADFSKIVWGSNWRDPSGNVQAYVADLGESEPTPPTTTRRASGGGTIAGSLH
jgi:hypothetical protein